MNTEERLAQVERQLRWLKRLAALAIAVGAVVVLGGQAKEKALPELKARSLTLTNDKGQAWLFAGPTAESGSEVLEISRPDGNAYLQLRAQPDGTGLVIFGKNMRLTHAILLDSDGDAGIGLSGKAGEETVGIMPTPDGRECIKVRDKNGKVIWLVPEKQEEGK